MTAPVLEIPIHLLRGVIRQSVALHTCVELDWRDPVLDFNGRGELVPAGTCWCGYRVRFDKFYQHQSEAVMMEAFRSGRIL